MKHARAAARLALVTGLTSLLALVLLVAAPIVLVAPAPSMAFRAACFRTWARAVVRILGARLEVEGHPPAAPFFLVTNHLGYLDVVVLVSLVPCRFVAKSEVASWPVIGALARWLGTIFVDRERRSDVPRVLEAMRRGSEAGQGVVFFPEGTSSAGATVLPFRPALFEAPARGGYPVSCASLRYETPRGNPPAGTVVCWWGDMTFADHLWGLAGLPSFRARVAFGERPARGADRRELAAGAHDGVMRLFRPTSVATGAEGP